MLQLREDPPFPLEQTCLQQERKIMAREEWHWAETVYLAVTDEVWPRPLHCNNFVLLFVFLEADAEDLAESTIPKQRAREFLRVTAGQGNQIKLPQARPRCIDYISWLRADRANARNLEAVACVRVACPA